MPSVNVATTTAGEAELMAVADSVMVNTGGEVDVDDETCTTTCALTGTPPTVALATIWSAPLLLIDLGEIEISATPRMPVAVVPVAAVLTSNALRPNTDLTLTMVPSATATPVASFTVTVRVDGVAAVTVELLTVAPMLGASASN